LLDSEPVRDSLTHSVTDKHARPRSVWIGPHQHSVKNISSAVNGMPGDSGVRRFHAPVSRNPAQQHISPKKYAAGGGDRDGEDQLSSVSHGYMPYYLPGRIESLRLDGHRCSSAPVPLGRLGCESDWQSSRAGCLNGCRNLRLTEQECVRG
jgi:hypothetical protein